MKHTSLCVAALVLSAMIPLAHAADEAIVVQATDSTDIKRLAQRVEQQDAVIQRLLAANDPEAKELAKQESDKRAFMQSVVGGQLPDKFKSMYDAQCNNVTAVDQKTTLALKAGEPGEDLDIEYATAVAKSACAEKVALSIRGQAAATGDFATQALAEKAMDVALVETRTAEAGAKANSDWTLGWGIGVGISFGKKTAKTAEISGTSGLVHVTETRQNEPRVLLETHYYVAHRTWGKSLYGVGPFITAAAGDDKVLQGVGGGVMFGMKGSTAADSDGLSIGFGAILDSKVRDLGPGFTDGAAPPTGETSVRYSDRSRVSGVLMFVKTF